MILDNFPNFQFFTNRFVDQDKPTILCFHQGSREDRDAFKVDQNPPVFPLDKLRCNVIRYNGDPSRTFCCCFVGSLFEIRCHFTISNRFA